MNYHHLTIEERCCIRKYYKDGISYRKIAELKDRREKTTNREINRNKTLKNIKTEYKPHTAQISAASFILSQRNVSVTRNNCLY